MAMKRNEYKMYFVYDGAHGDVKARDLLKSLLKDTIGTLFIEPDKLHQLPVGRTYFSDRLKHEGPFNRASSVKLSSVFEAILSSRSSYDSVDVSRRLAAVLKELLYLRIDFLELFADDTEKLRQTKIQEITQLLSLLAFIMEDKAEIPFDDLHRSTGLVLEKMFIGICSCAEGTYTAIVVQKVGESVGYPGMASDTAVKTDDLIVSGKEAPSSYEDQSDHRDSERNDNSSAYEGYGKEDKADAGRSVPPLIQQVMINNGPGPQIGTLNGDISFTIGS